MNLSRIRHYLLAAALPLVFIAPPARGQGSAAADVGFSYRTLEQLPGRPPFRIGRGSVRLVDGSTIHGSVRLQARRNPDVFVRDSISDRRQVIAAERVAGFSIEGHPFIPLKEAFPGAMSLAPSGLNSAWAEVLLNDNTGALRLYEIHGQRHSYVCYNQRTNAITILSALLPPRGFDDDFELGVRNLFADRPDLLHLIEGHYITAYTLPAAMRAYNSGEKMRF